jgi:UDP-N-acetylglucosamine--N-acetylmuramyl-(pentapeptide) pyrophosphoryl-undecaprenol N-acetylglucosamine transferase
MDYAYEVADLVISRSGACTISELQLVGKPTIFVPSPNVAEDHQTKNAMALVEKDAALMVRDSVAVRECMPLALQTLSDKALLESLRDNILSLGIADSADRVVNEIEKYW